MGIRVAIVDDHAVMRDGLDALISSQSDMEVVGQAADADAVEPIVGRALPDVLILDVSMPSGSGIEAIQRVRRISARTRVLVLTMHDDQAFLRSALAAGAAGYIVKNAAGRDLLTAIREVHSGRSYVSITLSNEGLQHVLENVEASASDPLRQSGLSQRERQVLGLLAQGYTHRDIAERLDVAKKTIDTYRARIGEKLGLRTRADIIRYALENGILK